MEKGSGVFLTAETFTGKESWSLAASLYLQRYQVCATAFPECKAAQVAL